MPSITIHLAIANEYIKKHPKEIKDIQAFHEGSISPDLDKNFEKILNADMKLFSHYYIEDSGNIDFKKFLNDKVVDINNDFWKGYYLHLIADEEFYMNDFKDEHNRACSEGIHLYSDYQSLGKWLLKKYHIDKTETFFTKRVLFLTQPTSQKTTYIKKRKLKKFIKKISKTKLSQ